MWYNFKKLHNNGNATAVTKDQFMFISTILEKIKETRLTIFLVSVKVL